MANYFNLKGTLYPSFTIGKNGPAIRQANSIPDGTDGSDGDVWIVADGSNSGLYQKCGGSWVVINDGTAGNDLGSLTPGDGNFVVGDGSAFITESGNVARTSLGLGTSDSVTFADLIISDPTESVITLNHNMAVSGDRLWQLHNTDGTFAIRTRDDIDSSGENAIVFERSNTVVDSITLRTNDIDRLKIDTQGSIKQGLESNGISSGQYILYRTTTNATLTELFLDGISQRLVLNNLTSWFFEIKLIARRTDSLNETASYAIHGTIDRQSGAATVALVGDPFIQGSEDSLPWDITVDADTTNGSLRLRVTGESGKTIKWVAFVRTVEVTV